MSRNWIATFAVESTDSVESEALQGRLWAAGCSGIWEKDPAEAAEVVRDGLRSEERVLLDAYFDDADWSAQSSATLEGLAAEHDARFLGAELLLERDWMESHRRLAQPRVVGDFLVDPREPDDPARPSDDAADDAADDAEGEQRPKWTLRVPARQAFGTGSHETTRLTLLALIQIAERGSLPTTIVDVGCGSGILSFAAHHLGVPRVVGYDVDPVAAFAARVNAGLNQLEVGGTLRFAAGTQDMLKPGVADLILVNVLPEKIQGAEPALHALLQDGGTLVLSGLLAGDPVPESTASALERWCALGWFPAESFEEGEWVAYRMTRKGGVGSGEQTGPAR